MMMKVGVWLGGGVVVMVDGGEEVVWGMVLVDGEGLQMMGGLAFHQGKSPLYRHKAHTTRECPHNILEAEVDTENPK